MGRCCPLEVGLAEAPYSLGLEGSAVSPVLVGLREGVKPLQLEGGEASPILVSLAAGGPNSWDYTIRLGRYRATGANPRASHARQFEILVRRRPNSKVPIGVKERGAVFFRIPPVCCISSLLCWISGAPSPRIPACSTYFCRRN